MAEFLWEILTEEIPARFQAMARTQLYDLAQKELKERSIQVQQCTTYCSAKRLTIVLTGVQSQESQPIEKRGPFADAGTEALAGFCRSWGISLDTCYTKETPKGTFWFAPYTPLTVSLEDSLVSLSQAILKHFYWPKRMVWGPFRSEDSGAIHTWVRPIRRLLCLYDGRVLPWVWNPEGLSIPAEDWTEGHPLAVYWRTGQCTMAPPLKITSVQNYFQQLEDNFVLVCAQKRRQKIETSLRKLCADLGCQSGLGKEAEEALLSEVTGLAEWPVCLVGTLEEKFLPPNLPEPLLITTIQSHQRAFPLRLLKTLELAPYFIVVTNLAHPSPEVQAGYQRVIRARLEDALFFWTQDRKHPLAFYTEALKTRQFFEGLGSVFQKVERLERMASLWDGPPQEQRDLNQAARLCKADLATGVVGEFPTLQGVLGKAYALADGVSAEIASAIEEHYLPQGEMLHVPPISSLGRKLGIMDRLDTLVGFFALGRIPSGSKDPLALRRAAGGFVQLCLLHPHPFYIRPWIESALEGYHAQGLLSDSPISNLDILSEFIWERVRYILQEEGIPFKCLQVALGLPKSEGCLQAIVRRAHLVHHLFQTSEGIALLAAYRRVFSLVSKEKQGSTVVDCAHFQHPAEHHLWALVQCPFSLEKTGEHSFGVCANTWVETLSNFFETVHVLEEPYGSNRLALLRQVIHFFSFIGNLSALFSSEP